MKRSPATFGNLIALFVLAAAIAGLVGLGVVAGWLVAAWATVIAFVAVVGELAYREWDQWAPGESLRVTLALDGQIWSAGLTVTNDDAPAPFRVQVVKAHAGPDNGERYPWTLAWDNELAARELARGEGGRLVLARLDAGHAARSHAGQYDGAAYIIPGPSETHGEVSGISGRQGDDLILELTLNIIRVAPPGIRELRIRIALSLVGRAIASFV